MLPFITYKINDQIYQIKDPMGVLTTLIIGKKGSGKTKKLIQLAELIVDRLL